MKAIVYSGNTVVGYHLTPDTEEFDALGTKYELVEELPALVASPPDGHYIIKNAQGEFEAVASPVPEPTEEQQRIAQLESDNLTLMEAIADLYEIMTATP